MMINEYNTKLLLSSNFRTGAAYSSNGFINELKEVLAHLDRKGKTVSMRGDSAFYNTEFMDICIMKIFNTTLEPKAMKRFKI